MALAELVVEDHNGAVDQGIQSHLNEFQDVQLEVYEVLD
jgi:hypothetical protein